MKENVIKRIKESISVKQDLQRDSSAIEAIVQTAESAVDIFRRGGKLLIAGNGGSAADAQHFAGELVNRFTLNRPALPAIALTTDTSVLTSIGNDTGYEFVFSRQIEAMGSGGDMFLAISTSGNALNIISALRACSAKGIMRVGLTGRSGGEMAPLCDLCIKVPSDKTPVIQESHVMILHILCGIIEQSMFGS